MSSQIDLLGPGQLSAAISNAVVRVFHEYTGRGPNRARAIVSDDRIDPDVAVESFVLAPVALENGRVEQR